MWARVASFEGGNTAKLSELMHARISRRGYPKEVRGILALADNQKERRLFISLYDSHEALEQARPKLEAIYRDEIPKDIRGQLLAVDDYEVMFDERW